MKQPILRFKHTGHSQLPSMERYIVFLHSFSMLRVEYCVMKDLTTDICNLYKTTLEEEGFLPYGNAIWQGKIKDLYDNSGVEVETIYKDDSELIKFVFWGLEFFIEGNKNEIL